MCFHITIYLYLYQVKTLNKMHNHKFYPHKRLYHKIPPPENKPQKLICRKPSDNKLPQI